MYNSSKFALTLSYILCELPFLNPRLHCYEGVHFFIGGSTEILMWGGGAADPNDPAPLDTPLLNYGVISALKFLWYFRVYLMSVSSFNFTKQDVMTLQNKS